jgi:phosphoglycolate phosphatase-like HAD superfamily hydrolase
LIQACAAIFDLDGTLVDTLGRFFEVFNGCLTKRQRRGLAWEEFLRRFVDDTLDDFVAAPGSENRESTLHAFWMEFLRRYREGKARSKLIPGAREVLARLRKLGVPVAVITSCIVPAERLREELESHGIGEFVKTVVTGFDVSGELEHGHHFSKVEIFRLAIERLNVAPGNCLVIGDYWNDVRDGKRAGAKTIAVLTGLMRREVLERYEPDAIIESVGDLFEIVSFKPVLGNG